MRRIDAGVGKPLCSLLTAVLRRRRSQVVSSPVNRILIIKLAEQGATVAALPALRRAVEMVGDSNVFVAVFSQNRFILDELGVIPRDNVLEVRTTSTRILVTDLLRLIRRTRKLGVDAAVDLEFFSRVSAIVAALSGATRRSGLHGFSDEGPARGDLMTHRVSPNPLQHVSHTFRALVEALEVPPDQLPALDMGPWELEDPTLVAPSPDELAEVDAIVRRTLGVEQRPRLILLNPNTGDLVPLRRWPTERYVELAQRMLAYDPDVAVLITGSPEEAPDAGSLASVIDSPRCASVAGLTSMRQLLVLYNLADVLVTNDSGPAHYATLTPIDVVVLFGPESPTIFGPVSPRSHHMWAALPCSPCVNAFNNRLSPCRNNVCMQRLLTDDVHAAVVSAYDNRSSKRDSDPS